MSLISCVLAVYNAKDFIEPKYKEIADFLEKNYPDYEIIAIDDGSTDQTPELLEKIKNSRTKIFRIPQNRGQGAALKIGMLLSRGEMVFYTDIDLATPLQELGSLLKELKNGADVAVGSRWLKESKIAINQPSLRRFFGQVFYRMINILILKQPIQDTNCGFKAYKSDAAKMLYGYTRCWRWAFNVEHLMIAQSLGLKIKEVPVEWTHRSESRVKVFRDVLFTLWELSLIKLRTFSGSYPLIKSK